MTPQPLPTLTTTATGGPWAAVKTDRVPYCGLPGAEVEDSTRLDRLAKALAARHTASM
jgi:hypothetical protein